MDWEKLKRIAHITSLLNQEEHHHTCSLRHSKPCDCGLAQASKGLAKMLKNAEAGVPTNEEKTLLMACPECYRYLVDFIPDKNRFVCTSSLCGHSWLKLP